MFQEEFEEIWLITQCDFQMVRQKGLGQMQRGYEIKLVKGKNRGIQVEHPGNNDVLVYYLFTFSFIPYSFPIDDIMQINLANWL